MKSVIYARVSSKEQEETGYSLPAQEKFLGDYAGHNNMNVVKVFSVSESAAGKTQRKIFNEMLGYIRKNDINVIIVETTDRLTRNFADVPAIDAWIMESENNQIHLAKEGCILNRNSRSHEWFMWRVKVATAEYYVKLLSENVKKGQKEKLAQGWLPTKPPVGYCTTGEKGHKEHIVDKETAPIMKKLFELYATGNYSLSKITSIAYESGLRNKNNYRIYKSRIAKMFSDPFYIGKIRYGGAVYKGAHKPLINEELFNKVQSVMHGKTTPQYQKHFPIFRALIRCGECGGSITWEVQRGHWYGHCNHYRQCTQHKYVRQEDLEKQLVPHLEKIAIKNERFLEWIKYALKESHEDEISYNTSVREELNKRYETAQKRLELLYDDKIDGKISQAFYDTKFEQYKKDREEVVALLKSHNEAGTKYYELGSNILDLAHRAKDIYLHEKRTTEERRTLLGLVFSNMILKDRILTATYTPAFEVMCDFAVEWNKFFEQIQNPAKSEALYDIVVTMTATTDLESLEPQINFRTSRNPLTTTQFSSSALELCNLLPLLNEFRTVDWKGIKQELELSGLMALFSQKGFLTASPV